MVIEKWEVSGWEDATKAIGLSYNDEFKHIEQAERITKTLLQCYTNSGELNFLTGVNASLMINASIKWWQQAMRYHWFQIVMSQSVMHSIAHKDIRDLDFVAGTPQMVIDSFAEAIDQFKHGGISQLELIYSVPVGLKEKARVSTNYLQLLTMYHQRKNHKLPEWQTFCEEVTQMPHMKEILAINQR
jgi:hypothetical protein